MILLYWLLIGQHFMNNLTLLMKLKNINSFKKIKTFKMKLKKILKNYETLTE